MGPTCQRLKFWPEFNLSFSIQGPTVSETLTQILPDLHSKTHLGQWLKTNDCATVIVGVRQKPEFKAELIAGDVVHADVS